MFLIVFLLSVLNWCDDNFEEKKKQIKGIFIAEFHMIPFEDKQWEFIVFNLGKVDLSLLQHSTYFLFM